jgi:hypothetical protein
MMHEGLYPYFLHLSSSFGLSMQHRGGCYCQRVVSHLRLPYLDEYVVIYHGCKRVEC